MTQPRLVLASGNAGKLAEFRALLADVAIDLVGLGAFPDARMPAEGTDYAENAAAKARTIAAATGLPALADDSGLEVAALGGAPGPLSARYGGEGLDDAGRVAHLLGALGDAPDRAAAFVCVAALAWPDGRVVVERGTCSGEILRVPAGAGGFGYDPVFRPEGRAGSMAQQPEATKNAISHRARALAALRPALAALAARAARPGSSAERDESAE